MDDYTVLIAEDNELIREYYKVLIERMEPSWHVHAYTTAEEAMEYTGSVNCVITDYDMGAGMSGLDFAYALADRRIPVFLVSGSIDKQADFRQAEHEGVIKQFVPKPVRTRTLIDLIRQQL